MASNVDFNFSHFNGQLIPLRLIYLRFLVLGIIAGSLFSCTVTNNMYITDPVCPEVDEGFGYAGIGTGRAPEIDSIRSNGQVDYSGNTIMAPNLCFGAQVVVAKKTQIRAAFHFPYIIGGFGGRLGGQYSLFYGYSKVNAAIGLDFGGVLALDSIKLLGSKTSLSPSTNGGIQGDLFIPVSIETSEDARIIFTPRISYAELYIRKNTDSRDAIKKSMFIPSLSIAARRNKVYLEFTASMIDDRIIPNFGLAYLIQ